jgi:ATP-dependent Lhr-like helicase
MVAAVGAPDPLAAFGPVTRAWFAQRFAAPTPVQARGWASIATGRHTLMLAPTGSGKTLAAFLACLDRLVREPAMGTRVVYISPIKALAYDVERNLQAPLAGLQRLGAGAAIAVDVRTGDTPAKERERQRRAPGQILITTPESLYLLLAGRARERLRAVDTLIIDEIHALAPDKRGAHLALSLERLAHLVTTAGGRDPQRIGLSATQRPLAEVARYLGGDRPVEIVDASAPPALDLEVVVPVADMDHPAADPPAARGPAAAHESPAADGGGMWPRLYPRLLELILGHRSTIVFVNSRRLAERVAQALTELAVATGAAPAGGELVRAHHGSIARQQRLEIEDALKAGQLRAITATSSLELGIDMGAVDLVIQIESPGAIARGLQRVGRAGHHVGGVSRGRILPKFRGDLLEAAVVARGMLDGAVEAIRVPDSALDVLAQQIVAMVAVEPWIVADLARLVQRAASYRDLPREALVAVLDMLTGRYPSDELAELRPRLTWDRQRDVLTARKGARLLSVVSGGTIPDRGTYAVHAGATGPRVGELDEEMVAESRPGETFILGATTWRIEDITRDRVIVSPAPGEPGKMPFWRGDGPGRPVELGRALGAFCRELDQRLATAPAEARAWLAADYHLDHHAADNLVRYVEEQRAATGCLPTDRAIAIERFRDELGDVRVCILTPFGGRVHAPWALALAHQLEAELGYPIRPLWTDDGISLRFPAGDAIPSDDRLLLDPDEVEGILVDQLARSSVFATHFRQSAARALLLPRRRPGLRTPLWAQRLRAQRLMSVALRFPAFPITLETYREVLRDVFDLPALIDVLRQLRARAIRAEPAHTEAASPFARSLVFDDVAAFLYEGDAPVAERKAQALTLDRSLLRALIGGGELRELLDADVLDAVEAELQHRAAGRRARSADEVHDLLRSIGDLTVEELAARCEPAGGRAGPRSAGAAELDPGAAAPAPGEPAADPDPGARALETSAAGGDRDARAPAPTVPWLASALAELVAGQRVAPVRIAGAERVIAAEDAARYRDALGVAIPPGLPAALLEPTPAPLESLVSRWARTHAPFAAVAPAARWGLPAGSLEPTLALLEARGQLVRGALRPGSTAIDACDPEVLRLLRRRTLARLRAQVAPVAATAYAAFLPRWHGIDAPRRGLGALRDALARLEGIALPFAELEARILPARVADYHPRMLDELGAAGELVWIGAGAHGPRDGRVVIVRRARARALAPAAQDVPERGPVHDAITAHLAREGASFLVAIEAACRGAIGPPAAIARPAAHGAARSPVAAALWDLAWAGVITNDTFAPLRALAAPARAVGRRRSAHGALSGRWSLVASLGPEPSATERGHALATALLQRWGIAHRAAARADDVPGGFSLPGDVLRAMEDAGTVRRGFFVEGLDGAQFADPGAIERVREPPRAGAPRIDVLAALDPACAWGAALPWPPLRDPAIRPARRVGATVILIDGALAAWVEPRGRRIATGALPPEAIERALTVGLPQLAARARRRELVIEAIDGAPAGRSPLAPALLAAGASADYRGLALRAPLPGVARAGAPAAHGPAPG